MDIKEFLAIVLLFLMIFIGLACISTSYGANVDVISDFDNNTLTTVELSESQSKTIWGFENLAKVQTRTGGDMQNTHIETDEGLYNYEYMMLNDTIIDRTIYNDTIIDREVYNDTIINRTFYNDTIIDRIIYNDTVVDRIIYNDTIINREVYNDTIVNRTIYNDTIVNRTIENITFVNKTVEVPVYVNKTIEVPFYKVIVIPEIIIDNQPVIPISNNNNTSQYNETNTDKVLNNNTTNTNNITININKENNTGTYISDSIKTVTMEKTGNDTVGAIFLIILFIILIQLYRKED